MDVWLAPDQLASRVNPAGSPGLRRRARCGGCAPPGAPRPVPVRDAAPARLFARHPPDGSAARRAQAHAPVAPRRIRGARSGLPRAGWRFPASGVPVGQIGARAGADLVREHVDVAEDLAVAFASSSSGCVQAAHNAPAMSSPCVSASRQANSTPAASLACLSAGSRRHSACRASAGSARPISHAAAWSPARLCSPCHLTSARVFGISCETASMFEDWLAASGSHTRAWVAG